MISLGHLKHRLGQYGALWVGSFLLSGVGVWLAALFLDLIDAADLVLPAAMLGVLLALGGGLIASLMSKQTPGTKLAVLLLAVLLVLPLLWAPVSAAVLIAFLADRSIEYSEAYAAFQIGVARLLFPISEAVGDGDLLGGVWTAFQWISSVVGFLSALTNIWPFVKRLLGPEPAEV
ncbi:hypothetical protein [Brevundimonas sp. GCM10030266]|uniref:hypothetical protein n=1 Tax=Brevundimonas sp. GCM10030266 TaxID=3273386 RepID=UPI0036127C9D